MGGYGTKTIQTSKRLRRGASDPIYIESDPAVGFGPDLSNVLCGQVSGLLVPASYFAVGSGGDYADQATAETAFLAAFVGINAGHPAAGKREKVTVFPVCEVEFDIAAGTFEAGDKLTWVWENNMINPKKFAATADDSKTIAIVSQNAPAYPNTGNVTSVIGKINVKNIIQPLPSA